MTDRHTRPLLVVAIMALITAVAAPVLGQCQNLIFRATQGNYEQSFRGSGPIVLYPNQQGSLRAYWDLGGSNVGTLSGRYGHPSDFGYQGQNPMRVRQVFRMDQQNGQNISRAVVRYSTANPGTTTIGYQITGANNPSVYQRIPRQCLSGVLTIQVQGGQQQQGYGSGGQGYGSGGPGHGGYGQPQVIQVAGYYNTSFGQMTLQQQGNQIYGTFSPKNGRIEGTLEGNVFRGNWSQAPSYQPPNDAGDFAFTFSNDGLAFNGNWRYGYQGPWQNSPWNGQRTGR